MDISKGGITPDVVQQTAEVDEAQQKSAPPPDHFKITQEMFMKGFLTYGQRFKLTEKEMKKYWHAIANGKAELSKDDFGVVNIHEALRELQGTNHVLMSTFVKATRMYLADQEGF